MSEVERIADLRHTLAGPLSGIIGEAQLVLMSGAALDVETRQAVETIEQLALRMRDILRATKEQR